jgi:hypothetical protein
MTEYVSKVSIARGVPTVHRAGRTIDGDARACGITKLRRCVKVDEYHRYHRTDWHAPLRGCVKCFPAGWGAHASSRDPDAGRAEATPVRRARALRGRVRRGRGEVDLVHV